MSTTTPTTATRGDVVKVLDQYGNETSLERAPGSILADIPGAKSTSVRWRDGSDECPVCLPHLSGRQFAEAIVVQDSDGCIRKLDPDPAIAGVQVPEYQDNEWTMVPRNSGDNCFPTADITTVDTAQISGIAAFAECQTGTLCLGILDACDASKVISTPPGTMLPWIGCDNMVPSGYTIADGKSLLVDEYPTLFAAIGYRWGGSGDIFNMPDMRGRHLRGVDEAGTVDKAPRHSENGSASAGLGSYQHGYMQDHKHNGSSGNTVVTSVPVFVGTNVGAFAGGTAFIPYVTGVTVNTVTGPITITVGEVQDLGAETVRTDPDETTVPNVATLFIISTGCRVS